MSTGRNIRTSVDSGSPVPTQNHSPEQAYYSLDAFYATLLSRTFITSTEAITFCRDLCSSHGFTVKQEQSTHKNIYVYCSREGLPDSHRNPKVNPQRNRHSQRCECRWRIVLFENLKTTWEFRKSQNAEAFIHNHPLLRPDEIKKEWPREVSEKIFELARQRLPTNEIRQLVREQYPDISWDDRRFYNRLSEERQKMKQRDTAMRTIRLVNLSAQICMVNSGSEDLSHYVESKLLSLLEDTCKFANVNSNSIAMPIPLPTSTETSTPQQHTFSARQEEKRSTNSVKTEIKRESEGSMGGPSKTSNRSIKPDDNNHDLIESKSAPTSSINTRKSFETLPKGYLAVPIPEHTFHVKMYSQNSAGDIRRAIFDMQRSSANTNVNNNIIGNNSHLQYVAQHREPRRRRSRALFAPEEDTDSMDLDTPPRKLSRQVTSSIIDDELDDMSSQSSPSNSQSILFSTTTQTHDRQLINAPNFNRAPSTATVQDNNTIFYGGNSGSGGSGGNTETHYLNQHTFAPPADNTNIYPSSGNMNQNTSTNRSMQQVMYDPFVQQPSTNEMGIIQHGISERPHSMTFGAAIPTSIRTPSRIPMEHPSIVRPNGYPANFTQLQNMIEENDGKQRFYSSFRDTLAQPSSPVPPRTSTAVVPQIMSQQTQYIAQQANDNSQNIASGPS
ncbi:hypothetical protein INT48_005283 [Thamnidium elegans]|uniref:FAR1 domain-containing protein n=1 Tax=Thamnidium elegans TaxID=101142 RepID=A0A8H7SRA7_9FUNG|nr:hypothetical protein INT48_005283 [Thamnidium elegans]